MDPLSLTEFRTAPQFADDSLISNWKSIVSSELVEFAPREGSLYGYQTSSAVSSSSLANKTIFYVSDSSRCIDFRNSYFTCKFVANACNVANVGIQGSLDKGGIHALIDNLVIRCGSVELLNISNYAKFYNACERLPTQSPNFIDRVGCSWGDSVNVYVDGLQDSAGVLMPIDGNIALAVIDTGTGVKLTLPDAKFISGEIDDNKEPFEPPIAIGDMLRIVNSAVPSRSAIVIVTAVTDATTLAIQSVGGADLIGATAGQISLIAKISTSHVEATRNFLVQAVGADQISTLQESILNWYFPLSIFTHNSYFPLPYLPADLEIHITWLPASLGLVVPATVNTNKLGYMIKEPRFHAKLVHPSQDVEMAMTSLFNSDGLVYQFPGARCYSDVMSAAQTQYNRSISSNITSAKSVTTVLTKQSAGNSDNSNAPSTQSENSQSAFYKFNMTNYRYSCGGDQFPKYNYVDCDALVCGPQFTQLMMSKNLQQALLFSNSINPAHYHSRFSAEFIMAADLKKDASYNCGIDISRNLLQYSLNFKDTSSVSEAVTIHNFITFDSCLVLSKSNGVRLYL